MYKGDLAATDASKSRCSGYFLSGQKLGGPGLLILCPPTGVSEKAGQWLGSCWNRSAVKIPNAKVSGPGIVRTKNRTSGSHREGLVQVDRTQLQLLLSVWSRLPGIYRSCSFDLPNSPFQLYSQVSTIVTSAVKESLTQTTDRVSQLTCLTPSS